MVLIVIVIVIVTTTTTTTTTVHRPSSSSLKHLQQHEWDDCLRNGRERLTSRELQHRRSQCHTQLAVTGRAFIAAQLTVAVFVVFSIGARGCFRHGPPAHAHTHTPAAPAGAQRPLGRKAARLTCRPGQGNAHSGRWSKSFRANENVLEPQECVCGVNSTALLLIKRPSERTAIVRVCARW